MLTRSVSPNGPSVPLATLSQRPEPLSQEKGEDPAGLSANSPPTPLPGKQGKPVPLPGGSFKCTREDPPDHSFWKACLPRTCPVARLPPQPPIFHPQVLSAATGPASQPTAADPHSILL